MLLTMNGQSYQPISEMCNNEINFILWWWNTLHSFKIFENSWFKLWVLDQFATIIILFTHTVGNFTT